MDTFEEELLQLDYQDLLVLENMLTKELKKRDEIPSRIIYSEII